MLDNSHTELSLIAEAADVAEGLKFLKRSMMARPSLPILDNILFPGDGTMRATCLDQVGVWRLDSRTEGHAPFTLPHKALTKLLAGANKGSLVTIAAPVGDEEKLGMLLDGMHSKLSHLPAIDFPTMKDPGQLLIRFDLEAEELRDVLAFVEPAISTEETRYYLNGVYLHPKGKALAAVATDGHRLALRSTEHSWPVADHYNTGVILPTMAVKAILDTLGKKPTGRLDVSIHKTRVIVEAGKWRIESRVVDGTFPDYTRVVPKDNKHHATLPLADTLKAVTRLHKLSEKGARASLMDFGKGEIEYRDADGDTHALPLKGCRLAGEAWAQGFNIDYMRDVLTTLEAAGETTVRIAANGSGDPAKFTPKGVDGCIVLMPMRY